MHDDRELLELAAKAAGYDVVWNEHWKCFQHRNQSPDKFGNVRHPWVPLDDDGDALRLAYSIRLRITNWGGSLADCRRAIVRAAAAIGVRMQ